nr:hypothetical protein [Variovorax boronicumulans]
MRSGRRFSTQGLTAAAVLACSTGGATAQGLTYAEEPRVWLQLSAFRPNMDSRVRLDETDSVLQGTPLDGENDFGLARRKTVPAVLLGGRLSERWRAEFEYFSLDRSGSASTDGIRFGDGQFVADIDTRMRTRTYRLSAGYSFLKQPDREAGVLLGAHVTDALLRVQGAAIVNGQPVGAFTERRTETVPAPTVGVYGSWRPGAGRWELSGRADLFKLHIGDYDGRLVNLQANAMYRVTPNVGLGLGWRYHDLRVDADARNFSGEIKYRMNGPQLFLQAGF